jgi:predicted adenylyl cyclase CyaB
MHLNIEFKARCANHQTIRQILHKKNADFKGEDHQIDTYFNVPTGRLKLREGNIENYLIHYERENQEGPKSSFVTLFRTEPGSSLKDVLVKSLGILAVVDKRREIYFIDNVKIHLDCVKDLGHFVEVEAIDKTGEIGKEKLQHQCDEYLPLFSILPEDLISVSYSDMILRKTRV